MVDGSSISLTRDLNAGVKTEDGTKIKLHSHENKGKTFKLGAGFVCISMPALNRLRDPVGEKNT